MDDDVAQAIETWAEGVRYTREHFRSDPTQFVGHTPVLEWEAAEAIVYAAIHGLSAEVVSLRAALAEKDCPTPTPQDGDLPSRTASLLDTPQIEALLKGATPGPWWVTDDLDDSDNPAIGIAYGMPSDDGSPFVMVATTPGDASFYQGDDADKEANALLLAAAPDLARTALAALAEVAALRETGRPAPEYEQVDEQVDVPSALIESNRTTLGAPRAATDRSAPAAPIDTPQTDEPCGYPVWGGRFQCVLAAGHAGDHEGPPFGSASRKVAPAEPAGAPSVTTEREDNPDPLLGAP